MGLTRLAIKRPLAILMFISMLVIMGLVARGLMPVARFPKVNYPFVSVSVSYPGASPEDVERLIAEPLEDALAGLPGVTTIGSTSSEGQCRVSVGLVEDADADKAAIDVERRVAGLRGRLPADASTPNVNKADPNAMPIMNIALTGRSLQELYDTANDTLAPALQSVLGVADVSISGGLQREVQVQLDYSKLESYGITIQQINTALTRENVSLPGGSVTEGRQSVSVRSIGQFKSADDLKNLIVVTRPTGNIFLKDLANIVETNKQQTRFQRYNGQDAVGLSIIQQSDANMLETVDRVKATVARLKNSLPQGMRLEMTNDASRFTRASLDSVQTDLGLAVLLTALVLLLFLHSWRNVFIVCLAIPTSLISTFLIMLALGFSLDTISLMALALMIGILVDDSIVVLENIHRHLKLGEVPLIAALNGRSEIGMAAIAITLTDVVVYIPVAFMQGNIGRIFREYGLTIAGATLFSLFVSFTLTPMLASRWMKHSDNSRDPLSRFGRKWDRMFEGLQSGYGHIVAWAISHRPVILFVAAIALTITAAFIPLHILGTEYAPQEDDNQFNVNVRMPVGSSIEVTDRAVRQMEAALAKVPEVNAVFASVSTGGFMGGSSGSIAVQLVDKRQRQRSIWQVISEVRRLGAAIPDAAVQTSTANPMGRGGGTAFNLDIKGDDMGTLETIVGQVEDLARGVPGIVDMRDTLANVAGQPEVRAVLDRRKMADLGITAYQVSNAVRTAIGGSVVTQVRPEGQTQLDVTVISNEADRQNLARLAALPLASTTGQNIRLGQVAQIVRTTGPSRIERSDRKLVVTLSSSISGRPIGDVARDVQARLATIELPPGYSFSFSGQVQQLNVALDTLLTALTLSIPMIYMLMVALYESWLDPLAIMFALPVALVGAFTGLFLTGNTINIFSMIGIIMLMGLVTKNGILLVDFTKTLRSQGLERSEAIVQAGRTRIRPVLMTSATVVCAMTPLALKLEAGAESRAPMAVVVIGGVISSTMLTLVLVPVMYSLLDDMRILLGRIAATLRHRRLGGRGMVPTSLSDEHGEDVI